MLRSLTIRWASWQHLGGWTPLQPLGLSHFAIPQLDSNKRGEPQASKAYGHFCFGLFRNRYDVHEDAKVGDN